MLARSQKKGWDLASLFPADIINNRCSEHHEGQVTVGNRTSTSDVAKVASPYPHSTPVAGIFQWILGVDERGREG